VTEPRESSVKAAEDQWLRYLVYSWAMSLPGVEAMRHFIRHLRVAVRAWFKPGAAARDV
jgi:hypothetical protein